MKTSLAAESFAVEALAHVRAAKDILRKHPLAVAGRHWYRALGALAEAEQELQEGQEFVLARREEKAGGRLPGLPLTGGSDGGAEGERLCAEGTPDPDSSRRRES